MNNRIRSISKVLPLFPRVNRMNVARIWILSRLRNRFRRPGSQARWRGLGTKGAPTNNQGGRSASYRSSGRRRRCQSFKWIATRCRSCGTGTQFQRSNCQMLVSEKITWVTSAWKSILQTTMVELSSWCHLWIINHLCHESSALFTAEASAKEVKQKISWVNRRADSVMGESYSWLGLKGMR